MMHKILLFLSICCLITTSLASNISDDSRLEAELEFLNQKSLMIDVNIPHQTKLKALEYETDEVSLGQSGLSKGKRPVTKHNSELLMKEVELMDNDNKLEFNSDLNQDKSLQPFQRTRKRSR